MNSAQTMRMSANSTMLFLSIAVRMATATPSLTQPSVSRSAGWPNRPGGQRDSRRGGR